MTEVREERLMRKIDSYKGLIVYYKERAKASEGSSWMEGFDIGRSLGFEQAVEEFEILLRMVQER